MLSFPLDLIGLSVTDRILTTRWKIHNDLRENAISRLTERIHDGGGYKRGRAQTLARETVEKRDGRAMK